MKTAVNGGNQSNDTSFEKKALQHLTKYILVLLQVLKLCTLSVIKVFVILTFSADASRDFKLFATTFSSSSSSAALLCSRTLQRYQCDNKTFDHREYWTFAIISN